MINMASPTIDSSSMVFPSQPTPNGEVPLSENDQMMDWTHYTTIYVFKPSHNNTSFSINSFKNSLSQVLVPYYPMAGRLRWIGGGRLQLDCCAAGALLVEASTDAKLDDYDDDFAPSDEVKRHFVPFVDYNAPIEEMPLLTVQVTKFSCGGLVLGIGIPHTLADGISALAFITSWASIARGEKTIETILQPFHDRRKALQPQKQPSLPLTPGFHPQEFDQPPPLLARPDTDGEQKKEYRAALLRVTKDQVEKLRTRANETIDYDELQPKSRPYSRYESITGYMWMCACKARSSGDSKHQPTVALTFVDTRRRLKTPPPEGFFGNATMMTVTRTCEFGDLTRKPLSFAAGMIREATWKFTDEYINSSMKFVASQKEMEWVRKRNVEIGSSNSDAIWESPNLYVGGWMGLPFYTVDFGWGRPCFAGPARLEVDGESFIMPDPVGDGALTVAIRLHAKHMDKFKKVFYENL